MRPVPEQFKMHFGFNELYPIELQHLTKNCRHAGQDYLTPIGTPIKACVDGVYYDKGYRGGFGYSVWIKFWSGKLFWKKTYRIILAHLSLVFDNYKVGDKIRKFEIVGLSGASGSATYPNGIPHPHLHLEIQELKKDGSWLAINPTFVTGT